jgi:hypothetical protein
VPYIGQTLLLAGQSKTAVGGPLQDFTLVLLLDLFFPLRLSRKSGMYHSLFLALLKARHGWRFGVGPRNETIFSCLGCVSPQPSVYSLVIEVSIDPITSLYRQVIRGLSLKWKSQSH